MIKKLFAITSIIKSYNGLITDIIITNFQNFSYLAHGNSMKTLTTSFRVGYSTGFVIVKETCKAILLTLKPIFVPWPSKEMWINIAEGFKEWDFPNCLGCIDGKHIELIKTANSGSKLLNYNKYFSIDLMACCDALRRFTWFSVGDYGNFKIIST